MVQFILFFAFLGIAWAGYPDSSFVSVHQPIGLMQAWQPGDDWYRADVSYPNADRYKIFIPPGTRNFSWTGYVGQGNGYSSYFVARAGYPPDATSAPDGIVYTATGFTTGQLLSNDCFGQNAGGYIKIADDNNPSTGFWVYVIFLRIDGTFSSLRSIVRFDQVIYTTWYNSTMFGPDGDPSLSGVLPSPKPTPTPTPTPILTPMPTINPTPSPTKTPHTTPGPLCNVLFCTLSGGHCVGNVCVPNTLPSPTPIPGPIIDTYQGSVSGILIKIELVHETDTSGLTIITIGDKASPGISYRIWEHDDLKTAYVLNIGYLEIAGDKMKINVFSGVTLDKK